MFAGYVGVIMNTPQNKYPHEWEELLAGYVLGDLDPEEVIEMHKIILEHPEIVTKIDHFQETLAMLPLGLSETYPDNNLRDRIAARAIPITVENLSTDPLDLSIDSLNTPLETIKRSPRRRNLWKLATIGLSSISAIALIALGFDNYQMRQQIASNQIELQKHSATIAMLQGSDNRMISLKGMGAIPAASGSVMIAPTEKTAMISIQNLRQIPQENSYRLWAIVDGKKVDCAQFRPDEQGKVFMKVPLASALKQSTTLIITIEPNQDMPEPTGEMVMKGEV
jgi:anti-sigma-K factor RskA